MPNPFECICKFWIFKFRHKLWNIFGATDIWPGTTSARRDVRDFGVLFRVHFFILAYPRICRQGSFYCVPPRARAPFDGDGPVRRTYTPLYTYTRVLYKRKPLYYIYIYMKYENCARILPTNSTCENKNNKRVRATLYICARALSV